MGRMPNALAENRAKDHVDLTAVVVGQGARAQMTPRICASPDLQELWLMTVGDGTDYTAAQAPIIEQYVLNLAMIEECTRHLVDENGKVHLFAEDEDGNIIFKENPYSKRYDKLMQTNFKLATELGLTPMARARLGLTKANTNAINISIADVVRKAMAESEGADV